MTTGWEDTYQDADAGQAKSVVQDVPVGYRILAEWRKALVSRGTPNVGELRSPVGEKKNQGGASKENQQAKHTRESRKQS
jgi:hypothetical protein